MQFGCLPPVDAPRLHFSQIWSGAIPNVPVAVDYLPESGWEMLGNDKHGTCVAVSAANATRLITSKLCDQTEYPTIDQVFDLYRTQNPRFPSDDRGMVIQ